MSRYEKYGVRDLTFSKWHRTLPDRCTCIDVDFLEYCQICRKPLALIELAQDVGQSYKPTTVLEQLAKAASIEAHLILYKLDANYDHGMSSVRTGMVHPTRQPLRVATLADLEKTIISIHDAHNLAAHRNRVNPSSSGTAYPLTVPVTLRGEGPDGR